MTSLEEQLYSWRRRYGWGQQRVAAELGVSVRTVTRWERGRSRPSPEHHHAIGELVSAPPPGWVRP